MESKLYIYHNHFYQNKRTTNMILIVMLLQCTCTNILLMRRFFIPINSSILENKDVHANKYRCALDISLTPFLTTQKKLSFDWAIGTPDHGIN